MRSKLYSDILRRLFILVLLYLVSCMKERDRKSLSASPSHLCSFSLLTFVNYNWFPVMTQECFLDLTERRWKRHLKFTNNKEANKMNHSIEEVKSLTLSQPVRIFREKCCLNSELYQDIVVFYQSFSVFQKKMEGQVPWSLNDMHQEKVKRT